MLTTKNQAQFSAKDKKVQMLSHCAMCPAIYFFVIGLIMQNWLFPWNSAIFPIGVMDGDVAFNQTYSSVWNVMEYQPCNADNDEADGKKCMEQLLHPVLKTKAAGTKTKVEERGDWFECDLPGKCHMRFMITEEARSTGMYWMGLGVAVIYSFVSKAHYAARAMSGMHLFMAVYCLIHAFVVIFQFMDADMQFVPYLYRKGGAMVWPIITGLVLLAMCVVNIVCMVLGMNRAAELTANARAANVASSGLVCGPMGSPEWKAFDGATKGKQFLSSCSLCCLGLWAITPCFYFTWLYVGGVTYMYSTAGDTSQWVHENASISTGHTFLYNGGYMKMKKITENGESRKVEDCTGRHRENAFRLDTGLKMSASSTEGTEFGIGGGSSSGSSQQQQTDVCADGTCNPPCTNLMSESATRITCCGCGSGDSDTGQSNQCFSNSAIFSTPGFTCPARRQLQAVDLKIYQMEHQECSGPSEDMGEEWYWTSTTEGKKADYELAYHQIRIHAKLNGAFLWATMISCFFTVIRGSTYASRSVSGVHLMYGILSILYIFQMLMWHMAPDMNYVPQYWRDGAVLNTINAVISGGIGIGLHFAAFVLGIFKVREVENNTGSAMAAPPAAANASLPPQFEEAPKEEVAETA